MKNKTTLPGWTLLAAMVAASATAPAMAQDPADPDTDARVDAAAVDDDDDRGFDDWGLLGLLGLLGLIPRKRRDVVVHDTTRPRDPNDPTRRT